MYEESKIVVI